MAQLTMVDQAKISLRPNTQFQIEQYADRPDSDQGALLNLVRGTLRTFTGLIAARNRDRFVMKTKVATVGIRGSGNVLFAGTATDCDPTKVECGRHRLRHHREPHDRGQPRRHLRRLLRARPAAAAGRGADAHHRARGRPCSSRAGAT